MTARERSEVDRAAYLRVACARDDELRREVESLLASHDSAGDFLDKPAANIAGSTQTLISSGIELQEYPPGHRVGAYELQKCIGRGGMGSVWLATRSDNEFKKQVAIKLVKRGMDMQEILRRFRLERQVLAGLTHPNIAALIDGGSTPDGLPYLVMEYVHGIRIDRYCEQHKSTITERLKLFRDVCAAVQYAHGNLVVHRDLKAGNILVTAEGTPKLLDFGIAKLIRTEFDTLAAAETRPESRPMTLDYASPEQVRGEPITTATDVYSLGVLLYKLLTGKSPYGLTGRSDSALRKAICEQEPLKPSAVVLTDEKAVIPDATQRIDVAQEETRDKARRRLKKKALRRSRHDRLDGAAQGASAPLRLGRAVFRRYPAVPGRPPGHRPERHVRLSGREIHPPQCCSGRGGYSGCLDAIRYSHFRAAIRRACRAARLG